MINIQNVQDFACQCLNRDVWSNDAVKNIIREHFIFWQVCRLWELRYWPVHSKSLIQFQHGRISFNAVIISGWFTCFNRNQEKTNHAYILVMKYINMFFVASQQQERNLVPFLFFMHILLSSFVFFSFKCVCTLQYSFYLGRFIMIVKRDNGTSSSISSISFPTFQFLIHAQVRSFDEYLLNV